VTKCSSNPPLESWILESIAVRKSAATRFDQ